MSRGEFAPNSAFPSRQLPDRELWLYDPYSEGRLETPTDEYGQIDKRELIKLVKQTIDPTYDWRSGFSDVHHLYWPNAWYDNAPDATPNPQEFRNLPTSKLLTPRLFHNWLHVTTEPAEVPDDEVMRYCIEAQRAAKALHRSIHETRSLFEREYISDARLERGLQYHLDTFFAIKGRVASLPEAFQPVDLSPYDPDSVHEIPRIARKVKLAKHVTMATVRPIAARRRSTPPGRELIAS